MIDRWGDYIFTAWQPHEILWVRAAMTLKTEARSVAYRDIASLRGCSLETVRKRAWMLRNQDAEAARKETVPIPTPVLLPPSQLRQPTKQQLMGRR